MSLATMLKIYLLYATFRRTEGIAVVPSRAHLRAASLHAPPSGRPALSLVDLGLQLEDCPVDVTWSQLLEREPRCADWEGRGRTTDRDDVQLAASFARGYVAIVAVLLLAIEYTASLRLLL